ncbi:DNA-binding domain-containing protein [Spirochaeta cellobiosiphila]|uniref:DNA-binding domain-containing protein n=1 Tax=Spirochaeta cellobiosiphila TaxID=504483 RepID=UPI0003FE1D46|nr:DNA-binding domain-containing protein [Spirochaeta cellobiosiphila]
MKTINYYLRPNYLPTRSSNNYCAKVQYKDTLNQQDLIYKMSHHNTTVTRQDILAVLDLLNEVVREQLLLGHSLVTDLFKTRTSIRGGFAHKEECFQKDKHEVLIHISPSTKIRKSFTRELKTVKVEQLAKHPKVNMIYDYIKKSFGPYYTAGGLVELRGHHLQQKGEPQILLIDKGHNILTDDIVIYKVTKVRILWMLPNTLDSGHYEVVLRYPKDKLSLPSGRIPSIQIS